MWQRFTYNGATAKQQAVFFFNTKEILDNKFGTPAPIPFQDWSHPIPNQMTNTLTPMRVEIKCFGKYTFKISNPAVFMQEIAGTADRYIYIYSHAFMCKYACLQENLNAAQKNKL